MNIKYNSLLRWVKIDFIFFRLMSQISSFLKFVIQSIVVGLAIAFLLLFIFPQYFGTPQKEQNSNRGYANAVQTVTPSVVSIYAQGERLRERRLTPEMQKFMGLQSLVPETVKEQYLGSGVILTDDGYIVTNFHVVQYASQILVALWDGQLLEANVIGSDRVTDLAILKVEAVDLTPAEFANSDESRIGDVVMAIGNPYGLSQTVTLGIISAKGRSGLDVSTIEDFIQTDAAINIGNSGGALINTNGHVVGISTASFNKNGAQGINFAIPANATKKIMKEILKKGRVLRGWLGVRLYTPQLFYRAGLIKPVNGVVIYDVYLNTPANRAGLSRGDVITHVNDIEIKDERHYYEMIALSKPGDKLELRGYSNGVEFNQDLITVERPAQVW